MSASLDPIVVRKLEQFQRRRFWLIVTRALSAAVVTLLLGMTLVALIDWFWLLTDDIRWIMSGVAYLAVVLVFWFFGLRRMLQPAARDDIAIHVEHIEPKLRENLLSAVELATSEPESLHDSPLFRSLLQGKVAQQMSSLHIPVMLPTRLIANWLFSALLLVACIGVLFSLGGARVRQLAVRALLPGANVARVSRVQIEILQPTPHSLAAAAAETVAVVVNVSGGDVGEVILETSTPQQGTVRQTMYGQTDAEYAANIHIADESVEYRILAGDAITQRFRIESRPRPRVIVFEKTYSYPEYSQLERQTVTETDGDIIVLKGTEANLIVELDQHVSTAELRIDPLDSDELRVIPLSPVNSGAHQESDRIRLRASIPVEEAAVYKVHLVSRDTGFENVFSPKYEIRPVPDLVPRAGFLDQQETSLLLPPNDILQLKGMAEDDLPLVSLEQQISINGREWETFPLNTQPAANADGRHVRSSWKWDLLTHQLKTGDHVVTKLVATDRQGNTGESIPLRVVIAAPDFNPERHAIMERKLQLFDHLADLSELVEEQKAAALAAIEKLRDPQLEEEQATLQKSLIVDLARKQHDEAETLFDRLREVLEQMPAGADAYDLELTGRVVARLSHEHTSAPLFWLSSAQNTNDPKALKQACDELKRCFERTADDAKNLALHYQQLMAHNFLNAVAADLDALQKQQTFVVNSPTQTWDRLVRQETIVLNQLQVLERLIRQQRQRLHNSIDHQMNSLLVWSESQRLRIQESTESAEQLPQLQRVAQDFLRQLESKQRMEVVDRGLPARLPGSRRDLDNRAGLLSIPLDQLGRALQQENRSAIEANASTDAGKFEKLLMNSKRDATEVDFKHRFSVDQLRDRRTLTQLRVDGDGQYAADAGLTHRAVTSLLNQHRQLPPEESTIAEEILTIAPAFRVLEAGHESKALVLSLNLLLNAEQWETHKRTAATEHPRQWDVVYHGLELASRRLREAGIPREIIDQIEQIRSSVNVRDAHRKIGDRRWNRERIVSAGHELTELLKELNALLEQLNPVMAEARAIIARYAPTIPQMAQQGADQVRKMEAQTIAVADQVETSPPESSTPELHELLQQQEQVNQQIESLLEALIEDANVQDILDPDQRERARDADDAVAIIQDPAIQMNRALEAAQKQNPGPQQTQALAQAAEQQEKTAQALEQVARHFEQLEAGVDVATSREELRQAERELGIARQMDQRFESSEHLAQMARQDSQSLIAELEAELQRNPAMQQALSEISRNSLQEARNALELAAKDDRNLQLENERSDVEYQTRKKELAAELRQLGANATTLSRELLNQANQSAGRGKSIEAQKKLAETQQKLNAAASQANTANEHQLLSEIASTAAETKAAIDSATETLKQAKQLTSAAKNDKIHPDDKTKIAQRNDAERQRHQFHEQQKRSARDLSKRADDAQRRADQVVRNAEKQMNATKARVQQAEKALQAKPEDAGLQRNLEREQTKLVAEQQQVDRAERELQSTSQAAAEARQHLDETNNKPLRPLTAENPATQLADEYAAEALEIVKELSRNANQLQESLNFENELTPTQSQLTSAKVQQAEITKDVANAATDVSRAARHERRLGNQQAAEPLQAAANAIQSTSNRESKTAEDQLQRAALQVEMDEPMQGSGQNRQALQAQQAVAAAEEAFSKQAGELENIVEPLIAATEAALQQQMEQSVGNPTSTPSAVSTTSAVNEQATNTEAPPASAKPEQNSQQNPNTGTSGSNAEMSAAQIAQGQELARTLDELDRQQFSTSNQPSTTSTPSTARDLSTLRQAAEAQQASLAEARNQAQQQTRTALNASGSESLSDPALSGDIPDFELSNVNRLDDANWGQLRGKLAEDLVKGRAEAVAEEYRQSVEAYFRVLAERARKKK